MLFFAGCSALGRGPAQSLQVREPFRIAVLPIEDLSAAGAPVNDIRRSLIAQLKLRGLDLLEEGQIEAFLEKNRIRSTSGIDAVTSKAWKDQSGTSAVLITSCELYARNTIPKVALTARLVGTGTAPAVLWTDSIGFSGDDAPGLLGIGLIDDPALLAEKAAEYLSRSLAQNLSGQDGPVKTGKQFLEPAIAFRSTVAGLDLKEKSVSFVLERSRVDEGAGTAHMAVLLNARTRLPVTVSYAATGGTATGNGVDYVLRDGTLTFAPGETTKSIDLAIVDDRLYEGDETVQISLKDPVNAVLGSIPVHTVTITDNDPMPSVSFTPAVRSVPENAGQVTIIAELSALSGKDTVVPFTVSGTAKAGTHYRLETSSPVVIKAGERSAAISLAVMDDAVNGPDETIVLAMGVPTNAVQGMAVSTITILDNDPLPAVAFALKESRGDEGVGTVKLDVSLNAVSAKAVTVSYTATGGTATGNGVDYALRDGTLTFAPGETTKSIDLAIVDDRLYEGDETVQISLKDPVNAVLGMIPVHTYTIVDNDPPPSVAFGLNESRGSENAGVVKLEVMLNAASAKPVTVSYAATGGTATGNGVDYALHDGTLTFAPGETMKSIELAIVDDQVYEGNETVQISLKDPVNAVLGGTTMHTYTIVDNDPMPSASFTPAVRSVPENTGQVLITVELSGLSVMDVTVPFTVSGTATAGTDYRMETSSPVVIKAGERSAAISFTVMDDALNEPDETIEVAMGIPTNAVQGMAAVSTITILDNDALPAVAFALKESRGEESAGAVKLEVMLNAMSAKAVTVSYAATGGTATGNGVDYALRDGTLTFAPGETTKSIDLAIVDDRLYEGDETVQISLKDPVNAVLGSIPVHTVTIADNDPMPSVSFTPAVRSVPENAGQVTIIAELSALSGKDTVVPFTVSGTAKAGTHYRLETSSPVVIKAGERSAAISLAVMDDAVNGPDETIVLAMGVPTNAVQGMAVSTITILDNDPLPAVAFALKESRGDEGAGTVKLDVSLNAVSAKAVTVSYAATGGTATGNGVDYALRDGTLTFAPGETTKSIDLAIVDDRLYEGDETVQISLKDPVNAVLGMIPVHTYTIVDNDPPPSVAFGLNESRGSENAGVVKLEVMLNAASAKPVTVSYAATGGTATGNGVDYALHDGTLTFAPGETMKSIELAIVDDQVYEGNETVQISLKDPVNAVLGGTTMHTYTIVDNDPMPSASFTPAVRSVPENTGQVLITVELSGLSVMDVTVPFTVSGTATAGTDYRMETSSPVVIKAGERSAAISFTVMDDRPAGQDKTLDLAIERPTNAVPGSLHSHRLTIEARNRKPSVAVLTFFNESKRKNAGEILMLQFVKALQKLNAFDVIEPGIVRMQLLNMRVVMDEGVSLADADLIYRNLNADLIVCGRVLEYQDFDYSSAAPKVDFSVEVIERRSNKVVWSSKSYHQGDEGIVLFNWPRVRTANALAGEMVRLIADAMAKERH